MLEYPHYAIITRPGAGSSTQDPATGTFTPSSPVTLYQGACDVQDDGRSINRREDLISEDSEAVLFLDDESGILGYRVGDLVTVYWDENLYQSDDAEVTARVILDGVLEIKFL